MTKPTIWGFRPGPTKTGLYSHRRWLEACSFGFNKKRVCTIRVAKTKALISCAVTAQLIYVFVFAYGDNHMQIVVFLMRRLSCEQKLPGKDTKMLHLQSYPGLL